MENGGKDKGELLLPVWQQAVVDEVVSCYREKSAGQNWTEEEVRTGLQALHEVLAATVRQGTYGAAIAAFKECTLHKMLNSFAGSAVLRKHVFEKLFEIFNEIFFSLFELYADVLHHREQVTVVSRNMFPEDQDFGNGLNEGELASEQQIRLLDACLQADLIEGWPKTVE